MTAAPFVDHFSRHAAGYAQARPTYPDQVFRRLAELAPGRSRAWDCATGNGQAAIGLARHFGHVDATDASAEQIANALAVAGVAYSVQPAESTRFEDESFDAACVAQALHWFDIARFYAEARRVLKPGGLLLVLGYDRSRFEPAFQSEYDRVVLAPLKPHWPKQNRLLWDGYRDVPFPFTPVEVPATDIVMEWTLGQVMDYVATWSATRRLLESDPGFLDGARKALAPAWGPPGPRRVTMPLHIQCGRHDG